MEVFLGNFDGLDAYFFVFDCELVEGHGVRGLVLVDQEGQEIVIFVDLEGYGAIVIEFERIGGFRLRCGGGFLRCIFVIDAF